MQQSPIDDRAEGIFGDRRTITDWVAAGKFAICHGCRQIEKVQGQGLPVDDFDTGQWKEGQPLSTGGGSTSLIKGGPHPNAARVFINWFLSRKGQTALQKSNDLSASFLLTLAESIFPRICFLRKTGWSKEESTWTWLGLSLPT